MRTQRDEVTAQNQWVLQRTGVLSNYSPYAFHILPPIAGIPLVVSLIDSKSDSALNISIDGSLELTLCAYVFN